MQFLFGSLFKFAVCAKKMKLKQILELFKSKID